MFHFHFPNGLKKPIIAVTFFVLAVGFLLSGASVPFAGSVQRNPSITSGEVSYDRQHVYALRRLLAAEGTLGYALNDRFIAKDLFRSGLGGYLLGLASEKTFQHLNDQLPKQREWKPYEEKLLGRASLEEVWANHAPYLYEVWREFTGFLQSSPDASSLDQQKLLDLTIRLYCAQSQCSNEEARNYLLESIRYEENAQALMETIAREQMQLFGYSTTADWFGESFVDLATHLVLRAAQAARLAGIQVSDEEAKADLWSRAADLADRFTNEERVVDAKEMFRAFGGAIGLHTHELVNVWREVLLMRKMIALPFQNFVLDKTFLEQLGELACSGFRVKRYAVDPSIFLRVKEQAVFFDIYCRKLDPNWNEHNSLPKHFYSTEELKERAPELLAFPCKARYRVLRRDALTQLSPIKELWTWQIADENWEFLLKQEPSLKDMYGSRLDRLFALEDALRKRLDLLCLEEMIASTPSMIDHILNQCSEREVADVQMGLFHPNCPVAFLEDQAKRKFFNLLEKAFQGDEDAIYALQRFSADGTNFIRFEPQERGEDYILTFSQARSGGALPFLQKQIFEEIKTKKNFSSLTNAEEWYWKHFLKETPSEELTVLHKRHLQYLSELRAQLQSGNRSSVFNRDRKDISAFQKQWMLLCFEKDILNSQPKVYYEIATSFPKGSNWSPIMSSIAGWLVFDELVESLEGGLVHASALQNSLVSVRGLIFNYLSDEAVKSWLTSDIDRYGPLPLHPLFSEQE